MPYVVTDPPYYTAVPYADLSDFCYVWLKRMVGHLHPDLFRWSLTPKDEEAIAHYVQPPNHPPKDNAFFEQMMQRALAEARRVLHSDGLAVVLFAHKGTAGWEALLNALVQAGWTVTASWPIETERGARMRAKNSAVLASSVFLACRPRPQNAGVGQWRVVQAEMNRRVAAWLPKLEQEGIHGADAIFAALGPALEVFSRYNRVETAAGEVISLGEVRNGAGQVVRRGYLSYVWEAVAREALRMLFREADPAGFEEEGETARPKPAGWSLPYDDARLMIQALGADEARLKRPGGILEVKGNTARLLPVAERRRFLLGEAQEERAARGRRPSRGQLSLLEEPPVQEEAHPALRPGRTTLDRLHQAMLLFAAGRSEPLRAFLLDEGAGRGPPLLVPGRRPLPSLPCPLPGEALGGRADCKEEESGAVNESTAKRRFHRREAEHAEIYRGELYDPGVSAVLLGSVVSSGKQCWLLPAIYCIMTAGGNDEHSGRSAASDCEFPA